MNTTNIHQALDTLPPVAGEPLVSSIFVESLLETLGFDVTERQPEFKTGKGNDSVDYAARKNTGADIFLNSQSDPFLLVEVKGRNINLNTGSPAYRTTTEQLKRYFLSPNCKTAQWGIITNSIFIQLFRRHGKVVVPATANHLIKKDNINEIANQFKHAIENTPRALTICVYNNKGGVGKTTTIINLAAILRKHGKRVLLINFDSQSDTTRSLNIKPGKVSLSKCLIDTNLNIYDAVIPFNYKTTHLFDVIPADSEMEEYTNSDNAAKVQKYIARLRDLVRAFTYDYDYILIDCPTQWLFFSQSGVYASDAVLIPTKHNGLTSLENAAKVIRKLIPEIQKERNDGGPIALPIFFNGERITDPAREVAKSAIKKIIGQNKDLIPFFFPRFRAGNPDTTVFELPAYASVATAAFANIPAVFVNKTVSDHYDRLAKEYFLHG